MFSAKRPPANRLLGVTMAMNSFVLSFVTCVLSRYFLTLNSQGIDGRKQFRNIKK